MAHFVDIKTTRPTLGRQESHGSALFDLPIAVRLVPQLQKPVFGVVPLPALRTDQVSAPTGTLAVKLLRDGKALPAAAWHEIHPGPRFCDISHWLTLCPWELLK